MQNFKFKTKKGMTINAYKWVPTGEIKAIVQISHGMNEHILRYDGFAKFLSEKGYLIYGNDHLGHGKSLLEGEELGYISDDDGFNDMVDEMKTLTDIIREEHKDLKIFMFSHSMGSFLAQRYIEIYRDKIDGLILSGTNGQPPVALNMGISLSNLIMKVKGRREKSKLIEALSFGSYNKKITPKRTYFDWLSRDEKEVDKYIEDPLCGNLFPVSFFHDLYIGMKSIHNEEDLQNISKDLPIYIFCGSDDPVGNYGKGIVNLNNIYKRLGIRDVEYKLYEGGRHEMLNEINRLEVIIDILNWLEARK
ncbi:alpha/beta hydrolase [Tissierella creatinophila]|uniref:Phospholipase YtpA n=1 Tax=Tissierella creatinophila DSM 6911 TaxID=1123403 RepID=A0A1U7M6C0_TISCR|nr:alpha/beta hydrolase [Tissierella creatinophila]OLS02738.1 phospholipase YtpA [Tissierella creatinophila DSM 6911]